MQNFDFSLILTCSIDPKNMPDLVRSDKNLRLSDYKKSFHQIQMKVLIKNLGKAMDNTYV